MRFFSSKIFFYRACLHIDFCRQEDPDSPNKLTWAIPTQIQIQTQIQTHTKKIQTQTKTQIPTQKQTKIQTKIQTQNPTYK